LYNRRYFDNRLKEELILSNRKKLSLGLLMIDIDKFKDFNDKFGHQTGDNVLKQVADTIKNYTRTDDIVCRYGGEEFSVILINTNLKNSKLVAERVRKGIQKIREYNITVSIGVSSFPETINIPSPEKIIKSADKQLYKAKNSGRNCVK
jgi:two-component system cell cycle response regulator